MHICMACKGDINRGSNAIYSHTMNPIHHILCGGNVFALRGMCFCFCTRRYLQRWSHSTHSPLIPYTTFSVVGISSLSGILSSPAQQHMINISGLADSAARKYTCQHHRTYTICQIWRNRGTFSLAVAGPY